MKKDIHPAYGDVTVVCSCGNTFTVKSTYKGTIKQEVCYQCHPFYTGKQKLVDTAGRVDVFERRRKMAETIAQEKLKQKEKSSEENSIPVEKKSKTEATKKTQAKKKK